MYHNVSLCIIMLYICCIKQNTMNTYLELKSKIEVNFKKAKSKKDMRFYLLCLMALESGARVSDLLRLEWSNIDAGNSIISFLNKKSKKHQQQNISLNTVNYITNYKECLEFNEIRECIFFNKDKNSIMSRVTANRRTQKEFGINFHKLRKESGQNIAGQKGVVMASKFLGHSKVSTTDLYLKISDKEYLKQMQGVSI